MDRKLALARPYTFIVLSLVLLLISPVILLRTPVDIFPNINIPVSQRHLDVHGPGAFRNGNSDRLDFRRSLLTTSVKNIEHIESQSLNGVAVIKVFLQPTAEY